MRYCSFYLTAMLAWTGMMGCTAEVGEPLDESTLDFDSFRMSVETTVAVVLEDGLTCPAQFSFYAMTQEDLQATRTRLIEELGLEGFSEVVGTRERCDLRAYGFAESPTTQDLGVASEAITGTYTVVNIPELWSYSAGWSPSSILQDGSAYGNMCGPWYETPKDYIAEFAWVPGAYTNMSGLRIMGLNSQAENYIDGHVAARVYSDSSIRGCIGWWSVFNAGGTLDTGDLRIYFN